MAALSTTSKPIKLDVEIELAATVAWEQDTTLALANRRLIALQWYVILTPEEAEHGPEKIKMLVSGAQEEMQQVRRFTRVQNAGRVVHYDLRNFRGKLVG